MLYKSDSLLYRDLPEFLPSGAGRSDNLYNYKLPGAGSKRGRGAGRAYAVAPGRWLGEAAAAITSDSS